MKKLYTIIIFSIFFSVYKTQTVHQIINKHLEQTGGITKWKSFNSVVLSGELVLGLNETYPLEIIQKRPNLSKTLIEVQGKKIILDGYNGTKAVKFNFDTNKQEIVSNYKTENFESDLIDYKIKGFSAVLEGKEKVENKECYKVKLSKNSVVNTYYFDTKNYQLIREQSPEEIRTYSNFKTTNGLTFAYKIEVKSIDSQSDFVLNFKNIQVNKVIPEKEFSF